MFENLFGTKARKGALSLQLLFPGKLHLAPAVLERELRDYSPAMARGSVEVPPAKLEGALLRVAAWETHAVQVVGFDAAMPAQAVETCVQPAHYGARLKARARAHASHALLYYAGQAQAPLEQSVALAAVAGVLATQGALVVLNESGHTSVPAELLLPDPAEGERLDFLRSLPVPLLYAGFVKLAVANVPGVWMRTHGCHLLGLPDLAYHAAGHDEAELAFEVFSNLLAYLLRSGRRFSAGDTVEAAPMPTSLRLRAAAPREPFLDSPGELFVLERA